MTRREWEQVALNAGVEYANIEVRCSDAVEHRQRVEQRATTVPGLRLPTWREVETREYHEWTTARIVLDTAGRTATQSFETLLEALAEYLARYPRTIE